MDFDCLQLVLLATDAKTLLRLLRSVEVPTHALVICSRDNFWRMKLETDYGIICDLSRYKRIPSQTRSFETCKRLYRLIMDRSYEFIWSLSCRMRWWNYAQAIIPMVHIKTDMKAYQVRKPRCHIMSSTKYHSTDIERQPCERRNDSLYKNEVDFDQSDWVTYLVKHGPTELIMWLFMEISEIRELLTPRHNPHYMVDVVLRYDRLDVFRSIADFFDLYQSVVKFTFRKGITYESNKILAEMLPKVRVTISHLESAIRSFHPGTLKLLLGSLTDRAEISQLPKLLSNVVKEINDEEIIRVLLSDPRTHSPDVLRSSLLLVCVDQRRMIIDLLQPYVKDGDEIVRSVDGSIRRINYLQYFQWGIGCCAVAVTGIIVYKTLTK